MNILVVGQKLLPQLGWAPGIGDRGATINQWGKQPISAHANIPKRKLERKIMSHELH